MSTEKQQIHYIKHHGCSRQAVVTIVTVPYVGTSCNYASYNNKKHITYMGNTQLQHLQNVHSCEYQFRCDCSSEEKTLFLCTPRYPEILNQTLVQTQPERRLCLLKKNNRNSISMYQNNPNLYLSTLHYNHNQITVADLGGGGGGGGGLASSALNTMHYLKPKGLGTRPRSSIPSVYIRIMFVSEI